MPDSIRLAFKIQNPRELQQLGNHMLDMEGFCQCGRLIKRLEGKFLLAAVMPSKAMTTLAAYCQPCSQTIQATLVSLRKMQYTDDTEAVDPLTVPRLNKTQ